MLALKVARENAEHVRRILKNDGLLDASRKIVKNEEFVEFPVLSGNIRAIDIDFTIVKQTSPKYRPPSLSFEEVKKTLHERLDIDTESLRGGWEKIGDILIVELPESLAGKKHEVGSQLLKLFPKSKSVVNRKAIEGTHREPAVEVIAGEGTETIHKENYCKFKIDVSKVMFSAGNVSERQRMAAVSNNTETVLDMFSGIGQFCIPLAKHSRPRKVYAIEKSPVTFEFLKENVRLNRLSNVEPILGDCREVSTPAVDRILMGYFFEPEKFLPRALESLAPGGTIHFHDIVMKKDIPQRIGELKNKIKKLGRDVEIDHHIVKSYAPMRWHIVFDLGAK
ncbi:class I SAM-dependent methyltransferase family protein [archaeon]|nr:class I SAM-dependent methyltransferase family protein [archaeon]